MVNLEITGRSGIVTEVKSLRQCLYPIKVQLWTDGVSNRIILEDGQHMITLTPDELREIVARWDAHI